MARHAKLRALVNRAFGPTGLARLEGRIRNWAEEFAEAAVEQREVDTAMATVTTASPVSSGHQGSSDPR